MYILSYTSVFMSNIPCSNCYGFVYAGLHNSESDYYLDREDLNLSLRITKKEMAIAEQVNFTSSEILQLLKHDNTTSYWKVLELFDHEKRSQHVAFLDPD